MYEYLLKTGLCVQFLVYLSLLSHLRSLILTIELAVKLVDFPRDDLKQDAIVRLVVAWIEVFQQFTRALRRLLLGQIKRIHIQMIVLEVIDKLSLISPYLVLCHEALDSTCFDKVQNVDLAGQSIAGFLVDVHSLLPPLVPWPVFDPTATAESEIEGADVLTVREFERLAAEDHVF